MNQKDFTKTILIVLVLVLIVVVGYLTVGKKLISPTPIPSSAPSWLKNLIAEQEGNPVANPPASLTQCEYKNKIVYYLPPRCCDISSALYNENGNVICSPDGGFTGAGDGKCADFFDTRQQCKIIWKDSR